MKKLHKIRIETPDDQQFGRLMPIGDIHYGNRAHDTKMFEIYMDWLYENKDVYVIGMADLIENASPQSLGWYDQIIPIDDQIDYIIDKFQPIQDEGRLIGLLEGNHERRTKRYAGVDINRRIANQMGAVDLGIAAPLQIKVIPDSNKRGEKYSFYAKHGTSGATTAGGRINAVIRMAKEVNAECYLMGHVHTLEHHKTYHYEFKYNKLVMVEKHFVITGSYMHYLGSYAQEKGYAPSGVSGSPKIKLHTDMHRISVSL